MGDNKLLFQTYKSKKKQNSEVGSNEHLSALNVDDTVIPKKTDLSVDDDDNEMSEKENKNSEQSANSSGF